MPVRKFIHIDMDAFYVSVEIRDNPDLKNLPVAVGGQSQSRGVLSTCNYIARGYGLHSAMPTSVAFRKCPDLVLLPTRMDVYRQVSLQLKEIFLQYTDIIEPLSLDEAYLDVTDCKLKQGSATLIAQEIRREIFNKTGLTASAGIAPIKFLCKIASDENKPNGQFVIAPCDVEAFIENLPLEKIPHVGKVTAGKLHNIGLYTGKDVKQTNEASLVNHLGRFGSILWQRCHGIDERQVVTSRQRKSIGVERTFAEDIDDIDTLKRIMNEKLIPQLVTRAEKHLASRSIGKLGVKVKFNDFVQTTREFKHSTFDKTIFDTLLLEALERGEGKSVRLLGVHIGLDEQDDKAINQLTLF